ncbi:anaphase-promoting complex, cyclosome, subunit 3 [Clostridium tepidiprofundi DSM 19306]|uniref:Anaphase-promoting complex, cyclosome, subunit 3 n=1 Tax=Clostridium tepidiprofundi DSM 19306 TaxID=1121338 RepID=A0A151B3P5_9CLOT|nr:hypothetical protein [Clostridium tepidiprofundi]KYH34541.1 anaphase-promoting complex, cyclosome, subunit 3 [Clostridium tepidiprofundi DSM 19306]
MKKNKFKISLIVLIFLSICFVIIGCFKYNSYLKTKANTYYKQGNYYKAYALYEKIFIEKFIDIDVLIKKSRSAYRLARYDDCIKNLNSVEKLIMENPQNDYTEEFKTIYGLKGQSYNHLKNYSKCIYYLNKYKELQNDFLIIKIIEPTIIEAYCELNEYDKCIEEINSILVNKDKFNIKDEFDNHFLFQLYDRLYTCYIEKDDYNNALLAAKNLINIAPNNIDGYFSTYYIYTKIKDKKYANEYLLSLKEIFPNNKTLQSIIKHHIGNN